MNKPYLWVDKYRPNTLDGYVWSDDTQKKQVLNWIKEKHIPNLLISGGPGTGKCLGPNEKITILIDKSKLSIKQLDYLNKLLKL